MAVFRLRPSIPTYSSPRHGWERESDLSFHWRFVLEYLSYSYILIHDLTHFEGREVIIRGNFVGDNNSSNSAAYPIFQVDMQNLECAPNPPQNGGQFLCSINRLPLAITNHTLTMFVNPDATIQQFHIDYIRHGSNSQAAQMSNGTILFVQSPDTRTPGLMLDSNWDNLHSLGSANDVQTAMQTSTPSSKATYQFAGRLPILAIDCRESIANNQAIGDSFAWWSCCMPPGTSSNVANGTWSVDNGEPVSFQIDDQFIQGSKCKDEKILFQTRNGQLQTGNHT